MLKKLTVCILLSLMLVGCSSKEGTTVKYVQKSNPLVQELLAGKEKLNNYPNYIVDYELERSDSFLYSLAVKNNDVIYTEYALDTEGNLGKERFGSSTQYVLNEYRFSNGDWYNVLYSPSQKLPAGYKNYRDEITVVYLDTVLDNALSIKKRDTKVEFETTYGKEEMSCYDLELDTSCLKDILGSNSYGTYMAALDEAATDNVKKYCEWMSMEMANQFVCGSIHCSAYIDSSGRYRGLTVTADGLGDTLYYTGLVVTLDNEVIREAPDIRSAESFMSVIAPVAEIVGSASDYEEAKELMQGLEDSFGGDHDGQTSD